MHLPRVLRAIHFRKQSVACVANPCDSRVAGLGSSVGLVRGKGTVRVHMKVAGSPGHKKKIVVFVVKFFQAGIRDPKAFRCLS